MMNTSCSSVLEGVKHVLDIMMSLISIDKFDNKDYYNMFIKGMWKLKKDFFVAKEGLISIQDSN